METAAVGALAFISLFVLARRFVLTRRSALTLRDRSARTGDETLCRHGCRAARAPTRHAVGGPDRRSEKYNEDA